MQLSVTGGFSGAYFWIGATWGLTYAQRHKSLTANLSDKVAYELNEGVRAVIIYVSIWRFSGVSLSLHIYFYKHVTVVYQLFKLSAWTM